MPDPTETPAPPAPPAPVANGAPPPPAPVVAPAPVVDPVVGEVPPQELNGAPKLNFGFDEKGIEQVFGKIGADGRPENVQPKYWDADKKTIKADVVFNQLRWAEGKLGKSLEILGAPNGGAEYQVNVPKDVAVEMPADDPAVRGLFAVARKHDVSQAFVDELVTEVAKNLAADKATNLAAEKKLLGDNADQRIKDMGDFLRANLPPGEAEIAANMVQSADQMGVMEKLIARAMPTRFNIKDGDSANVTTQEQKKAEWEKLHFAVDENGTRLMSKDPAYRERVDALRDEVFGTTRRDQNGVVRAG